MKDRSALDNGSPWKQGGYALEARLAGEVMRLRDGRAYWRIGLAIVTTVQTGPFIHLLSTSRRRSSPINASHGTSCNFHAGRAYYQV
ncbi:hypothetical protein BDQ12DRAFT_691879 [Crucibulum laeve]|uniref:Uncharacterized protein n=1 Tax=Crucibulum laeve TaxID=68775 RepID=A0A5C3LLV9_9AGAR|nr:hypothetical protein BDQ12DRAFT_691879 [Crucibulum laeve]